MDDLTPTTLIYHGSEVAMSMFGIWKLSTMPFCVAKYFIILSPLTTICIFHNSLYYVKTKLKSGGVSTLILKKKRGVSTLYLK